ncbi:hypothetical protein J2796_002861 [Chryseobacterium vietnamense]|nr:hypothetical protein [Chryseobacterium vietnamense]
MIQIRFSYLESVRILISLLPRKIVLHILQKDKIYPDNVTLIKK